MLALKLARKEGKVAYLNRKSPTHRLLYVKEDAGQWEVREWNRGPVMVGGMLHDGRPGKLLFKANQGQTWLWLQQYVPIPKPPRAGLEGFYREP